MQTSDVLKHKQSDPLKTQRKKCITILLSCVVCFSNGQLFIFKVDNFKVVLECSQIYNNI